MVKQLGKEHHEEIVAGGVASNGQLIELWEAPEGTWTIINSYSSSDGKIWSCLVASGEGWESINMVKGEDS